jgi:hypothetical protein
MAAVSGPPSSRCLLARSTIVALAVAALWLLADAESLHAQGIVGPVKITFDEVGSGTVLSRCIGGGTLPNCTGGTVRNVYPGLTFYSGPGIQSGPLNNNQVVVVRLPPVPLSFQGIATSPPVVPSRPRVRQIVEVTSSSSFLLASRSWRTPSLPGTTSARLHSSAMTSIQSSRTDPPGCSFNSSVRACFLSGTASWMYRICR